MYLGISLGRETRVSLKQLGLCISAKIGLITRSPLTLSQHPTTFDPHPGSQKPAALYLSLPQPPNHPHRPNRARPSATVVTKTRVRADRDISTSSLNRRLPVL